MAPDGRDRRAFLKAAGGAALTTSLFAGKRRGAAGRISLGFIGVGHVGTANIGYAAQLPGFRISAVCDVDQPAMERAQAQVKRLGFNGVKAVRDFREILADKTIDAVCISTPTHWHPYMTVEACKAGKDVYVEAPSFVFIDEGPKMVEAARQYQRVVQAGTVQRSGKFIRKVREIVRSGDLGEIAFCRMFQPGAIAGRGLHPLDIVRFAFDEAMPESIFAQGGKRYVDDSVKMPETSQTMMATYRFPGFVASYENTSATRFEGTTFHGTKATLRVSRAGYSIFPNNKTSAIVEEESNAMSDRNVSHWNNWLECINSRKLPVSDIETCVRSTAACVLANLSMLHRATLDWDDKAFTVKQAGIKPFLKCDYRAPWKLKV
jgi:predicted dehydrogenase